MAAFTRVQFKAYQPLRLLSYLPDRLFWPTWAPGFHALNLAIFGLDSYLLFRLAARQAHPLAAAGAVLLFAVHPLTVEPVAWISSRKDLVASAFFLAVLLVEDARPDASAALAAVPAVMVRIVWQQHRLLAARPIWAPIDVLATLAAYGRRVLWPTDLAALYPPEMPAPILGCRS